MVNLYLYPVIGLQDVMWPCSVWWYMKGCFFFFLSTLIYLNWFLDYNCLTVKRKLRKKQTSTEFQAWKIQVLNYIVEHQLNNPYLSKSCVWDKIFFLLQLLELEATVIYFQGMRTDKIPSIFYINKHIPVLIFMNIKNKIKLPIISSYYNRRTFLKI